MEGSSRYITIRGLTIHYHIARPIGPMKHRVFLLCAPGFITTCWRFILPELTEAGCLCVLCDMPGFGESEFKEDIPVEQSLRARYLWGVLDTVDLERDGKLDSWHLMGHGSACGAWWTSSSSSTVTGEPNGYTIYDIEGAHIKDWRFKGTNKDEDFQLRVFDGNDIYYQSKSYPLNWYTASQKAGSGSITVKGSANLRYCFVAQVFNDDDTYWTVELRRKSTGEKIGSFKRLANKTCTNIAATAYYFNAKGKNSDSYSSVTASHYWYYLPSSKAPANESDWEVVATQKIPGGEVTHSYKCSHLTVESDFNKEFYF